MIASGNTIKGTLTKFLFNDDGTKNLKSNVNLLYEAESEENLQTSINEDNNFDSVFESENDV